MLAVRTAPIYKGTYLLLFSKPENSNETIEIVHHHGFIKGWNQIKHLKNFPNLGFRIEKKIDHEDVTGNWIVHPDNPFHEKTGVFYFKNGEIVQ